jgi:hypothetical protein
MAGADAEHGLRMTGRFARAVLEFPMSRVLASVLAVSAIVAASAAFAQSSTIRIEPRPVYGATVTIEEGVRVYRPLPPDKYVIVNPNGTPVNLGVAEVNMTETRRSYSKSVNKNYNYGGPWNGWWGGYRPCIPAVGDSC